MKVILYRDKHIAEDFEAALRPSFSSIEVYTSMAPFCTRLRHTSIQGTIIVLVAANEKALSTIMPIQHLIEDVPTILILPVKNMTLLSNARKLHPRFIGDLESGPEEIIAVIQKMLIRKSWHSIDFRHYIDET